MKRTIKRWIISIGLLCVVVTVIGYVFYGQVFKNNTQFEEKKRVVFVRDTINFSDWLELPENQGVFLNKDILLRTALLKKFNTPKIGRFAIDKNMNSNSIINLLRSGEQDPVVIRLDNIKTIQALAGKLGNSLKVDSASFITALINQENYPSPEYNETTIACVIRPNTYHFLWTMTPEQFIKRMVEYNSQFWTEERTKKAKAVNLTPNEIITLASIVKAETANNSEASKIAGLYLNRLNKNIPLQSDPTAVFGAGLDHVSRVTNQISVESAYNTYQNSGLPPGPINFPEDIYIDAVLNPEKHEFLYMCAQPEGTGFHNFSRTFEQHKVYATQYRKWLNKQGIR